MPPPPPWRYDSEEKDVHGGEDEGKTLLASGKRP